MNSQSLLGASHVDAVRALRTAGDNLTMVVADGYDTSEDDVLYNPAHGEPTRFSPDSASSATSGDSFPVLYLTSVTIGYSTLEPI